MFAMECEVCFAACSTWNVCASWCCPLVGVGVLLLCVSRGSEGCGGRHLTRARTHYIEGVA